MKTKTIVRRYLDLSICQKINAKDDISSTLKTKNTKLMYAATGNWLTFLQKD